MNNQKPRVLVQITNPHIGILIYKDSLVWENLFSGNCLGSQVIRAAVRGGLSNCGMTFGRVYPRVPSTEGYGGFPKLRFWYKEAAILHGAKILRGASLRVLPTG